MNLLPRRGCIESWTSYAAIPRPVYLHIVFSTKDRRPYLADGQIREELHRFIGGVCNNQVNHHRQETFQDELRRIMTKYGVKWDENYVWD